MKKIIIILFILIDSLFAQQYASLFFDGNCVTCHEINIDKSAPSIKRIKEHYLRAFPQKKDFIVYMTNWILNPEIKTSIMQEDIKKFGLMPNLSFDKFTLEQISEYIYTHEFK